MEVGFHWEHWVCCHLSGLTHDQCPGPPWATTAPPQLCIRHSFNEELGAPQVALPLYQHHLSHPQRCKKRREGKHKIAQATACCREKRHIPPSRFGSLSLPYASSSQCLPHSPRNEMKRTGISWGAGHSLGDGSLQSRVCLSGILPLDSEDPGLCDVVRVHEHYLGTWQLRRRGCGHAVISPHLL